jgi:hypothetical protein
MGRTFKRHGDAIRGHLTPVEEELLRSAREQLRAALAADDPADPVVQRLFPSAVLGDPDADQEVRRLLKGELVGVRLAGLDAVVEILDRGTHHRHGLRIELRDDEPLLLLGVVNDLRLAIGARLGIEELDRDAIDLDDPVAYRLAVMDHLAWWQEELLAIVDPAAVAWTRHADPQDLEPEPFDPSAFTVPPAHPPHDEPGVPAADADAPAPDADGPAADADGPAPDGPAADADRPAADADAPAPDADAPAPDADGPAADADGPAPDAGEHDGPSDPDLPER